MVVELWDDTYGNAIDEFDSEDEAYAFVRQTIEQLGKQAVANWALDRMDDRPLIRGTALVRRALTVAA